MGPRTEQCDKDTRQRHALEDRFVPDDVLLCNAQWRWLRCRLANPGADLFRTTGRERYTADSQRNQEHPDRMECVPGLITIATAGGGTLVAWKKDNQLGWQLYDDRGRPSGTPGSAKSDGNGAAGVLAKNGDLILFR